LLLVLFPLPTKTTSRTFAVLHQVHPTPKINRTRRTGANKTTPEEGGSIGIPSISSCAMSVSSGGKLIAQESKPIVYHYMSQC